jgi:tetratricopeptide (TPR) repeat protein
MAIFCTYKPVYAQYTGTIDSLENALTKAKDTDSKIEILLGLSAEITGYDQNKSLNYAIQAEQLSTKSGNKKGEINALLRQENCYFRMSEYQHAMECAENAYSKAIESNLEKEIGLSLNVIGSIYSEMGEFEKGFEQFFKSLRIFEKTKDKKGLAQSMGLLGSVYITQKEYNKALGYLTKSISIAKELENRKLIARQSGNLACVYILLEKYDSALIFLNEAVTLNTLLNDKLDLAINYSNIGHAKSKLRDYEGALVSYSKSLQLHKETNNRYHIAECYCNLGEYYIETGNKSASIDAFKAALDEAQQNGYNNIVSTSAGNLGDLYLEREDTSRAFKYKIIEFQSKDSLNQSQKSKTLSILEFQYQTDKKEFEKKIARQKKDNMLGLIILGLITGLIITLLILSRHRIKAKHAALEKKTIEKELNFKNKELTINLMALMKKNEMLTDISNRLTQIEKEEITEETKGAISRISHELSIGADEKIWKEFSVRFQEVHSGFYEALLEKFPELTQSELKLCAFLRLNMSTKEISELTGQSTLTIEKSRTRLRKKIGIANSELNLVTFLLQI